MAESYAIVYMYHIFSFIIDGWKDGITHSFIDGYLGSFYTLAIVNNVAMNI